MQFRTNHPTDSLKDSSSIVELLQERAANDPDRVAYTFLADGEAESPQLTFSQLDARAKTIAAELQRAKFPGGRALLLFPPGVEFITAFLGCLYAGTIAVPAYPPRKKRGLNRLASIAEDARPDLILTTSSLSAVIEPWVAQTSHYKKFPILPVDLVPDTEALSWHDPGLGRDALAFLQYTSGSTGSPRGVMVSHGNIIANEEMIRCAFDQSESSIIVSWLPLYHDMGLIGGVLQPLYVGATCVLMSPVSFLQRPRLWLEAITEYSATTSGGPNFAYDLCVRKIPVHERDGLDLSSWKVAFNGAEPVRSETMERFAEAFSPYRFQKRAFYPCYGLAEATLFVTGGEVEARPQEVSVSAAALQENRVVESTEGDRRALVGCGRPWMDHQLLIVDPETQEPCLPGRVGEIWVAGPSVARGYWSRPQETSRSFEARLSNKGQISYLRTGDLGFVHDADLFITGRLKDLIIVRGRNYYPQDIEYTVESCHQLLRPGCGAAFSITIEDEERVVVVHEVDRRFVESEAEAVIETIRGAVAQEHELFLHDVVLIRAGSIPKTSSGKIQRHACQEGYLSGTLDAIARSVSKPIADDFTDEAALDQPDLEFVDAGERRKLIEEFLKRQAARILRLSRSRVDIHQSLVSFGLDSLAAVELKHAVEERFGVSISLSALLDEASIAEVADEILEGAQHGARATLSLAGALQESPLTYGQRGLWFVQRLAPDVGAYHIPIAIGIDGDLDVETLKRAFQALVDRHPALRTTFQQTSGGEPVQRIHDSLPVDFISADAENSDEETLNHRLEQEAYRPFDLVHGPLLRVALFRRSAREHVLIFTVHHLVADLRSLLVVFRELKNLYLNDGEDTELKPLPARYSDYVAWEQERLNGAEGKRLWNYWSTVLSTPPATIDLPTDRPRPPVQTYRGASKALNLDPQLTAQLRDLARSAGASLFVVLLTAFKVMLHRYTGQTDIVVGSPVAGRNVREVDDLVGYFVNPLVLRTDVSGSPSFRNLMQRVRRTVLGALEHREYPFALLAERLNLVRDPSRSPLFQVMFAFQQPQSLTGESLSSFVLGETGTAIQFGDDLTFRSLSLSERQVPFDLILTIAEGDADLETSLQYNRDLFDEETMERMLEQFRTLLNAIVADPNRSINSVKLLTPSESTQLLVHWNATDTEFDRNCLVHELFETQVERTPDAVAIVSEEETISYSELESRANRLAQHLRRMGVAPGAVVAINVVRSLNLVVAILGILKTGAAYLPLDPAHPDERQKLILENAGVELVITTETLRASLSSFDAKLLLLDAQWSNIAQETGERPPRITSPEQAAYLLYTSGSTGRPKGVAVPHRAVVNFLTSMARQPGLTAEDVFVSVTTASFDIFGLELYLPLMKGARLVLPSRETTSDGAKLLRTLKEQSATAMQATPATWRLLLQAGWQGTPAFKVLCGGEALDGDLAHELVKRTSSVWNLYGPTETTIWSALYKVSPEDERAGYVPIGQPIANTHLHVLDANLELVPTGAAGELFIGGDGLAQGYWNLPALTADKFVPDHLSGKPGARLYRTGDLARRRRDGILEYLSRLDNQVKVRGFRIELGEVEAALASCRDVREAVVIAWKDAGEDQRLVGYIVPANPESAPRTSDLRTTLLERLPEPFVPSLFVVLDTLPLTPNGKVDRKALPKPESQRKVQAVEYLAPRSEVERLIVEVWRDTLAVEKPGLSDNFFDLGGHSLLLAQVQSRLLKAGYDVSMLDLLRYPTIGALAARLGQEQTGIAEVPRVRRSATLTNSREIAIIGMAGRFPKARNIEEFWQRLSRGDECISFFTDEELAESGIDASVLSDPDYVKAGGVLEGADLFDASFFGFHPREAELMDPQHRIFLECAWHALEDAGYDSTRYRGRIGVFGGAGLNTYLHEVGPTLSNSSALRYQAFIGNDKDFLTTRVSYKLNLKGPSVNVQTACSTSLVAVHLACQSLLAGECDMALAGGVAIRAPHKQGYFYETGGILSPDAHCRAFDKDAQGTVFGSGAGIVVLKPLEKALADRDNIYAVIKGSAINNDGGIKLGYTAPSVDGQAEVITDAINVSGVDPETVTYVEAHGTGTPLGDPIEVAALQEVFGKRVSKKQFCAIGSVKTNIGHLDTAAGVSGLIKTVCALRHGLLPPSINFAAPNPKIDFANSAFYVNTQLTEWRPHEQANRTPRRAGVSSFGIGGTNAHVVLEEAPPVEPSSSSRPLRLLMLSAKTSTALDKATQQLAEKLKQDDQLNLDDVAYTTQVGRQVLAHRRVALCADTADAVSALESLEPGRVLNGFTEGNPLAVVFLFPGQGTQHVNMARELYETEPAFASEVDKCVELLKSHLELDLRALLFPSEADAEEAARQLEQTMFAQPALFVVEYALAKLWLSWGVRPAAMLGHSIGEYVAACLAGVFSLDDALSLVAARGRLMQSMPRGAMLAVQLSEEELRRQLGEEGLSVAAINGPAACVVSGTMETVSAFEAKLSEQGIVHTRLHTSHAFHSSMMEPILDEFTALVQRCKLHPPALPYISNVTGGWIDESQTTDVRYWSRQLRETVRFGEGVKTLLDDPDRILLEVGPGHALSALARTQNKQAVAISSLSHPRDKRSDAESLLTALGRLWIAGIEIDWQGFYAHEERRRVSLPLYPFEGQRHWIKREAKERTDKSDLSEWFYVPTWRRSVFPYSEEERDPSSSWLLLGTDEPFSTKLAEYLRARGVKLTTARLGDHFAQLSEDSYAVNYQKREDYDALFQELHARERSPQIVVHALNVTANNGEAAWEDARSRSFDSLLFLAHSLERTNPENAVRIAIVSNNMQKVCGERELRLEKSLLLGPLKVIPQEYPNQRCQSIDLLLPEDDRIEWQELFRDLFEELTGPLQERVVAYRGGERWVQTFEHWYPDKAAKVAPRLRDGGVYLITGGLGGIGLTLAEEIARTVNARLVLIARSALPEREHWPEWIATHGEQDRASQAIQKIRLLEDLGSEVLTFAADVSDAQAMSHVVSLAREKFGNIRGVIHAAGVAGGGIIHLKTPESAEQVLKPKTRGTLVLHSVLQDSELDFFLLCSSTNAIIGGFGQSDYCAANAFCDAFAQSHFSQSGPYFVSVNWDRWQEVGMAARGDESSRELSLPALDSKLDHQTSAQQHPLLGSLLVETTDRVVFTSRFSPVSHWVLSEHMVAGLPTVPGTTYLEMARAAFAHLSPGRPVEIREVTFSAPLVIREGDAREVATLLDRNGDAYSFRILSRRPAAVEAAQGWEEHARGKIGASGTSQNGRSTKNTAVNSILSRGQKISDNNSNGKFITTGPRWHSLREAYVTDNEALAVLEIDERFSDDLALFELHPSLLDIATGFVQFLVEDDYLPLVYERLTVHSPIPKKAISHVKFRGPAREQHEIITCDVSILDEEGREAVTIDGFSMKRVAAGALQQFDTNGHSAKSLAPERAAIRSLSDGIPTAKGAEAFRRILSNGTGPQLIVSTRDIHELIDAADSLTRARLLEEFENAGAEGMVQARPEVSSVYTEPASEVERRIASVWQRVLGMDQVGLHDNFFELGGTSLNGIQLVSELKKEFKMDIPVVSIFEATTVAGLAKYLSRSEERDAAFEQIDDRAEKKKRALAAPRRPPGR